MVSYRKLTVKLPLPYQKYISGNFGNVRFESWVIYDKLLSIPYQVTINVISRLFTDKQY